MFYRLLPTLINLGKVYIAESPLYEIKVKDKSYFAYNEAEKNSIISKIGDQKYSGVLDLAMGGLHGSNFRFFAFSAESLFV